MPSFRSADLLGLNGFLGSDVSPSCGFKAERQEVHDALPHGAVLSFERENGKAWGRSWGCLFFRGPPQTGWFPLVSL